MGDSGFDVSRLNLLPKVTDLIGIKILLALIPTQGVQMLMEFKIMKKKGLLVAHLEKAFFIPKKKSSKFEDSTGVSSVKTEESARFIHVSGSCSYDHCHPRRDISGNGYPVFETVRMALAIAAIAIALPNPMHSSLTLSNARGRGAFCTRRRTHCLKITGSSLADGSALFQAAHYTD